MSNAHDPESTSGARLIPVKEKGGNWVYYVEQPDGTRRRATDAETAAAQAENDRLLRQLQRENQPTMADRATLAAQNVRETYRPRAEQETTQAPSNVTDDSHLSPAKLAEVFGVPADPLRSRLKRWRAGNHNGWIENPERRPREAKYIYKVGAVLPIIQAMKATSQATSERPARKKSQGKRR